MKTIYILPFILIGCKSPQQLIDKAVKKQPDILSQFDTVIEVPEIYYDTIYHSDSIQVIEAIRMIDMIFRMNQLAPKSKHDYKYEKDLLAHELRMAKIEARKYKDSLIQARKTSRVDYKHERDVLRHKLKLERINASKYKDSLTESRKIAKIEGRTKRTDIRRSKRAEIVKEKARLKPWMWILLGFALAHLIRWMFIVVRSFTKMPV